LIADASNREIDRLNARAQRLRAQRGELASHELPLASVHYGLCEGDHVAFIAQHRPRGQARVENGTRGEVTKIEQDGTLALKLDGSDRLVRLAGEDGGVSLRLAYAQHVYRQQGATVDRAIVLTGSWQTSKETAYVEATRARHGTDWYVARDQLGIDGQDPDLITRFAERMTQSRAHTPSVIHQEIPGPEWDPSRDPLDMSRLLPYVDRHANTRARRARPRRRTRTLTDPPSLPVVEFAQRAARVFLATENRPECVVSSAAMTELQSSEVEKVLLHVSDARARARKAAETCARDGAEPHIVAALADTERQLAELHRKLSQGTYYAVPDKSLKLAV